MDSLFQCYIEYLPREIIVKKYGKISSIFELNEKSRRSLRPIHYGLFREEIENIWNESNLIIDEILADISKFDLIKNSTFNKKNKGQNLWGSFDGNYCFINQSIDDNKIYYFQFGLDITKKETKDFVQNILEIASKKNFILLGSDLKTFEPTCVEIDNYFKNSPAYKFINTEKEFLKNVALGKEKTDVQI